MKNTRMELISITTKIMYTLSFISRQKRPNPHRVLAYRRQILPFRVPANRMNRFGVPLPNSSIMLLKKYKQNTSKYYIPAMNACTLASPHLVLTQCFLQLLQDIFHGEAGISLEPSHPDLTI